MDTKLTLKLNENVIERAKKFASNKKTSLSRLIENYLDSITQERQENDFEISPFVKSISGEKSFKTVDWKEERKDYLDYLDQKYQ